MGFLTLPPHLQGKRFRCACFRFGKCNSAFSFSFFGLVVDSCGRIQRVNLHLQGVGLENPSRAVFLPAIFHAAKFPRGGFRGEKYGEIVSGISVYVALDALEVFSGQFKCRCHYLFSFGLLVSSVAALPLDGLPRFDF